MRRCLPLLALLVGCVDEEGRTRGPIATEAVEAALRNGVPGDLMLAVAVVEQGILMPARRTARDDDDVPTAGLLELRRGAFDSLARGAELMGLDERSLREERALGTEAGARVLAELGRATGARAGSLDSWRPAVETLSGFGDVAYGERHLHEIFTLLRRGGEVAAPGETIRLRAHPEVADRPPPLRQPAGTPDFPGAIWTQTSCANKCDTKRVDGNASVDTIVVHDTEGSWSASLATLQKDPGKSAHYLVDADGSRVAQFIPETYTAWHAGNSCYNRHSIGIEHVGYVASTTGFATALYRKSVELVQSIRTRWTIPLDRQHIIAHYQVPNGNRIAACSAPCSDRTDACISNLNYGGASHHTDPGRNWQWCQYMRMLGGSCTCADAYPHFNCSTDKTLAVRCSDGTCKTAGCVPEILECSPCESQPIGTDDICHGGPDMSAPRDLARPADLAVPPDGTAPRDLAPPRDLAIPADLARPSDAAVVVDLAVAVAADLATPADLAAPDLARPDMARGDLARPDLRRQDLAPTDDGPRIGRRDQRRGDLGDGDDQPGCQCRSSGRAADPPAGALALGALLALALVRPRRRHG